MNHRMAIQSMRQKTYNIIWWIMGMTCWISVLSCGITNPPKTIHQEIPQASKNETIATEPVENPLAKIVFDSSAYHFGQIKQGDIIEREVFFTNMGPGLLIIELISACECTTLDWSRLPIKPGNRSSIKIIYNSKEKQGAQIVDIDVIANTQPPSTYTKFSLFVIK